MSATIDGHKSQRERGEARAPVLAPTNEERMLKIVRAMNACAAALLLAVSPANADSVRLVANEPKQMDFGDITSIPASFGTGEFTFELWIKPDERYPVGTTGRGTTWQLENWSDTDIAPYSRVGWWYAGNWLLDGFTRPEGVNTGTETREGSFALQFYGGGRVRWLFADADETATPTGSVWSVQAYPATSTPSLLDGRWHAVTCVRRWNAAGGADLELWIDGKQIAVTSTPHRTNMRQWWDKPAHPGDPEFLGGWALGAEVMTAWDYFFTQYEDYKGLVDEMRFWSRAKSPLELSRDWRLPAMAGAPGLAGLFNFDEGAGTTAHDRLLSKATITFHKTGPLLWADENAPLVPDPDRK